MADHARIERRDKPASDAGARSALSRRLGVFALVLATLAVCAGSIGVAILALPLADYRSAVVEIEHGEPVAVLSRSTRRTAPAVVELEWSESHSVAVGEASGKVTEVFMSDGVALKCGDPVVAIDGAARLAMCGEVPPWRDVTASTTGPDADQLAELLVEFGLLSEADRSNGARRAAAWKKLARFLGLPDANTFHPSDVVWIGRDVTPSRVTLRVGDRVSGDSVLFEIDAALQAARVHLTSGAELTGMDWVFSVDGSAVESPILGDASLAAGEFEAIARSTITEAEGALPTQIPGIARLASPISYFAVPPSALVTAPDGSTCVVLANGGTTTVTVVESLTGLAMVDGDLAEGATIRDLPPAGTTC